MPCKFPSVVIHLVILALPFLAPSAQCERVAEDILITASRAEENALHLPLAWSTINSETLALVSPGDEVIYPDPGFPTYAAMIAVAGGTPVPVPLRETATESGPTGGGS